MFELIKSNLNSPNILVSKTAYMIFIVYYYSYVCFDSQDQIIHISYKVNFLNEFDVINEYIQLSKYLYCHLCIY